MGQPCGLRYPVRTSPPSKKQPTLPTAMALLCRIQLAPLDYLTVALYGLVVVGLGMWFSRQQHTTSDYLLAGRSMGWIVVGISQLASLLSAISYLGQSG